MRKIFFLASIAFIVSILFVYYNSPTDSTENSITDNKIQKESIVTKPPTIDEIIENGIPNVTNLLIVHKDKNDENLHELLMNQLLLLSLSYYIFNPSK